MVASSGYRFYVEIHAEFSGWVAISKRENVGGMVIDRDLVTNFFFLLCLLVIKFMLAKISHYILGV